MGSDIEVLYFPVPTAENATKDVCAASPTAGSNAGCPYGSFVTSTTTRTTTFTGVTSTGVSTEIYTDETFTEVLDGSRLYTTVYTETGSECVYSSAGLGYQNRTGETVYNFESAEVQH
jgi:hypothetical protein